jgi:hypothetical protein
VCWAHARRKLFELADIASTARGKSKPVISPIAFEAQSARHQEKVLLRHVTGAANSPRSLSDGYKGSAECA